MFVHLFVWVLCHINLILVMYNTLVWNINETSPAETVLSYTNSYLSIDVSAIFQG